MSTRARVLILEDEPADARLMSAELEEFGLEHEWRRVSDEASFRETFAAWPPDIVLVDYSIPLFGAPQAIRAASAIDERVPVIVVSGTIGEEPAVDAIRAGAEDYVHKDRIGRLGPAVERALRSARERRERFGMESALAERVRLASLSADVGLALTRGSDGSLSEVLGRCTDALVHHLDAAFARVWTLDREGETLELQASSGLYTHLDGGHARVPVGALKIGRIASERAPHLTNSVLDDPRISDPEWARREGMVAFAGYPLEIDDRLVGVMAAFARRPLPPATLRAMGEVGREIALGIERIRIDAELRRHGDDLERVFGTSPNALTVNRASDGVYLEVNDEFLRALGYGREEVIGRDPWDLKVWGSRHDFREVRRLLREHGVVRNLETELRTRDGRRLWALYSAATLTYRDVPAVVSFCQDIGRLKRTETALRAALARAEESDRLKTSFLENMSHEFRTPLNVILGYNSLIAERLAESGDREAEDLVDAVARGSRRLLRSLHAVLDLSRFQTETFPLRLSTVDVASLARRVVAEHASAASRKGIALELEVGTIATSTVHDESCLTHALGHLVDNAIKFTAHGSIVLSLRRDEGSRLVLAVRDTGVGIAGDYLPQIFSPFSQESSGRARAYEGLGLGLALVRRYLECHHATIDVESRKGEGTTFTIRFAHEPASYQPTA